MSQPDWIYFETILSNDYETLSSHLSDTADQFLRLEEANND